MFILVLLQRKYKFACVNDECNCLKFENQYIKTESNPTNK